MTCQSCGSTEGVIKSGLSKKTGKPYKGWKCSGCEAITWLKAEPAASAQPATSNAQVVQLLLKILSSVNQILSKMPNGQTEPMDAVPGDEQPDDEEAPF